MGLTVSAAPVSLATTVRNDHICKLCNDMVNTYSSATTVIMSTWVNNDEYPFPRCSMCNKYIAMMGLTVSAAAVPLAATVSNNNAGGGVNKLSCSYAPGYNGK